MATRQGVPITLALVVAAPLCWGVIAAKPPRIASLQLSGMRPTPLAYLEQPKGSVQEQPKGSVPLFIILLCTDQISYRAIGKSRF